MTRNSRVRLTQSPNISSQSEYAGYQGQTGTVLCNAGNGGVWVRFDCQQANQYVGCPVELLEIVK